MIGMVVIILGPTGVGKTGVSIELAKALQTEIISADSMMIYRSMDIGTAKPSIQQRTEIKHHLIDILSPSEPFSAGRFRALAEPIIERLIQDGKIPLIVGGTGLYIKALTYGLFNGPHADWRLREQLSRFEQKKGLYERLKYLDPVAASTVHPNDLKRIIRKLEILTKSDQPLTELFAETLPLPYRFIKIGLIRERAELYQRINQRVDEMLAAGLIQETIELRNLNPGAIAMQAIGYKEIGFYLDGLMSLDQAVALLKQKTRNYAKRQLTWFKKEPDVVWVDITGIFGDMEIFQKIEDDGLLAGLLSIG
jgi:tRNA dimethylallyltransferase